MSRQRGAPKYCHCGHMVRDHFTWEEDHDRKCSIPGCDCGGLELVVAKEVVAEAVVSEKLET